MAKTLVLIAATFAAVLSPSLATAATWSSQDVGSVGAAGSSTNTTNADGTVSATVKGSGSDIWETVDEFQFDYQTMTGDGTITARVASMQHTDDWAKAGVMIREQLTTGSTNAFVAVTPANGFDFQWRPTAGGLSRYTAGPSGVAAPYWVRLTRSGTIFSAYSSSDGATWNLVGQATVTMAATVYIGLVVTSHLDGTLNTASFDHVVVSSAGPPASGWSGQDVGSVGAAGSSTTTTNADGTASATVKGSGSDIWDVSDEFQFDYQPLAGDGTITARVASLQQTNDWAKAGVMIREQLTTGSTNAFVALTPANGFDFQWRPTAGGLSRYIGGPLTVTAPYWVRLTRSGNTFSAYSSSDGTTWSLVGQATITMAASAYIGLGVTSHNDGTLNTVSFDHVALGVAPVVNLTVNPASVQSGGTTQLSWTSTNATSCTASGGWSGSRATSGAATSSALTTTTTFTLTCTGPGGTGSDSKTVTVGAPPGTWTNQDVGSVGAAGGSTNTTNADGTVSATVKGSGYDIWDTVDEFQFDYQPLAGDGTITARVASLQHTDDWAKAGVMIREQLTTGSTNAFVAVTPANGVAFQRRTTTGSASGYTAGPLSVTAPYWVRLNRSGNTFSAYSSPDGTTWTFIGQIAITMASSAYVGLAVTSHHDGTLNTASFDHVTLSSSGSPTVSLTVNPATVPSGSTTQLSWTSTNATSCIASGGWSGPKATSGSATSSALPVTTTFTLTCTGPGGTGSDSKTVTVTSSGAVNVPLAPPIGNVNALVNDGAQVVGGIDGQGNAYSQTLTGPSVTWAGVTFTLGASGTQNGVSRSTVPLPAGLAGHYSSVRLLATAVNGNQTRQTFVVNYDDLLPPTTITQSLSDWHTPQNYQGESRALAMKYSVTGASGTTRSGPTYLYGYELAIDGSRTVKSIDLPSANRNVVVVAMDLIAVDPTTYSSACNPNTYHAIGDGTTDNTTMIQTAIDACFAQGGGVVELRAQSTGNSYLTRPLTLKSNVQLQIDSGVTLKARWSVGDGTYTPAYINWVYQPKEALISANGANHVGIVGNGIIDGAGNDPAWWALHDKEKLYPDPSQCPELPGSYCFSLRPWLLEFYKCDTVTISGVKLQNPPYWTQALRFSSNITEYGVVISAPPGSTNTDGVDVVGSTYVTLSDLNIGVNDDNIAIKSGLPILPSDTKEVGLPQMATAHVHVRNIFAGDNGLITAGASGQAS